MFRALIPALLLAFPAAAGSISGTIRDSGGTGLAGMTVRLWSCAVTNASGCKTWSIIASTTSAPAYSFGGLAGSYLVDARPGPGVATEYTDRYYAAGEAGSSTAGFVSADIINGSNTNSGIDIYMLVGGGIDGFVHAPDGTLLPNVFVRAEVSLTPAIHHNDQSQGDLKNR